MKKWIFPLILFVLELIFAILFLTPSIVQALPQFMLWIRDLINVSLTGISKLLHLPTFKVDGVENYVVANGISLFIVNALVIIIYFIVYYFVHKKHLKRKKSSANETILPKSEFDPVLFEKRVPIFRLVFMWVPLNLWLVYFFLLNSKEMQGNLQTKMPKLYALFAQNFEFYQANVMPLLEKEDAIKFAILVVGLFVCGFLYWMIFSIFALFLKKPMAKAKAKRALREHERRLNACQAEEVFIENSDILEHAKFLHSKSIVETIATIDIKQINEDNKNKQNYFDDLAHGIVDLGVENTKKIHEVPKPITEKKPLRVILSSLDKSYDTNNIEIPEVKEEKVVKIEEPTIVFESRFDVLNEAPTKEKSEEKETVETEKKEGVKPLNPQNLRKPVKVVPVNPKNIPLKELVSEEIIEVEGDKND